MSGGTGGSISGRNNDPSGCQNTSGTATESAVDATAGTAEGSIGIFFSNLFVISDNENTSAYINATRSSSLAVTVHAASADEAARTRDTLDECGAVAVHEQAATQGYDMTRAQDQNTGA